MTLKYDLVNRHYLFNKYNIYIGFSWKASFYTETYLQNEQFNQIKDYMYNAHTHIYISVYIYEVWKRNKFHHCTQNGQPYCILKKNSVPEEKYIFNIQLYFSFIFPKILGV